MIISKTPYRISFFGGGSDYFSWYKKYGGKVLSTTIDKYIYISCRKLPKFFDHKYRIVWSKIENVKKIEKIKHKVVKNILIQNKIKDGLEIHYDGDLPSKSGMGSSSSFSVGLIKALSEFKDEKLSKIQLAKKAIHFEQRILKEVVGSQDQVAAAFGGFNKINFYKNGEIDIKKINSNYLKRLNSNLLLIYTGIQRNAEKIAKKYVNDLSNKKKENINRIIEYVNEGENLIKSGNLNDFGKLLHESWIEKKSLNSAISNRKIDELYNFALKNGCLGGKLLGAGSGGFLLLYIENHKQKKFLKNLKKIFNVPFKFSKQGSNIILNSK
tara:strand:+ start:812 stop:1789 length:978 start_codon:yes stop_codon:yes gene_type:complete